MPPPTVALEPEKVPKNGSRKFKGFKGFEYLLPGHTRLDRNGHIVRTDLQTISVRRLVSTTTDLARVGI